MKVITGSIDVTKIDKSRLFKGKKGTYLNFTILMRDQPDQYDNDGMVVESVTKEEREAGTKGNILGNVKIIKSQQGDQSGDIPTGEDDLPF